MSGDIKRMDIKEFREVGYLQEANRLFFHPHGLALEITKHVDGTESISSVWDSRDDPEGVVFGDPDPGKVARVAAERARHVEARTALFGGDVQWPGQKWAPPTP